MAQNKAMTTGEHNGRTHTIDFDYGKTGKAKVQEAGSSFHACFESLDVDIMDHAACVWFRMAGDIVTHFHVPQHVGRRIATEATRHGRLRKVTDSR